MSKGRGTPIFGKFVSNEQMARGARLVGLALVVNLLLMPNASQGSELCYNVVGNTVTDSSGCSGHVTINGPTSIGPWAFANATSIETITIGPSVTTIEEYAFQDLTGLRSLTLGNSIETIGVAAFANASSLTSLTIPDSVISIGEGAFYGASSLSHLALGNGVESIGVGAFSGGNSVTYLQIPDSVISMGDYAFSYMYNLETLVIGNGLTSISENAFSNATSLTSLDLGSNIEHIETAAFAHAHNLTSLTIPNSVISIEHSAFYQSHNLTSLTLGTSLKTIGSQVFYECFSLEKVTFPESVISIGDNAFSDAIKLREIRFLGNDPTESSSVFTVTPDDLLVFVDSNATGFGGETWDRFLIIKEERVKPERFAAPIIPTYSISYFGNSSDVTYTPVDFERHRQGMTVAVTSQTPVRSGYTFLGWNSATDGSGTSFAAGASLTMGSTNPSLYAQWKINTYSLTFNANGELNLKLDPLTREFGTTIALPTLSTDQLRSGYTFLGWNTAANGSGTSYKPGGTFKFPASDTTLYAQWKINSYSLTYDGNSHERGMVPPSETQEFNSSVTVKSSPRQLTRKGYTLQGWNTSPDGSGNSYAPGTVMTQPASDLTLYANWLANTYQVRFLNSLRESIPNGSFATGGLIVSAPTPSERAGYVFKGWSVTPARTQIVAFPYAPTVTRNILLYAVWERKK